MAEEFFYNNLSATPVLGSIAFDSVTPKLRFKKRGEHDEFDIVLTNGASVALIEVKYKALVADVDKAYGKVQSYRRWRPEHQGFKVYAGLAGLNVAPEVIEHAQERGIFVLQHTGDVMQVDAAAMRAF